MNPMRSVTALLLCLTFTSCALHREPCEGKLACAWQKEWGHGAFWGGVVGSMAGATSLGVAANNGSFGEADNESRAIAIASGAAGGALLGAIVGHLVFDEPAPEPKKVAARPKPKAPPAPMLVLSGTQFEFDSAKLTQEGMDALSPTADSLKANSKVRVSIQGHTDSQGPDSYNQGLSERRAEAVKSYLVGKGIAAGRISTLGFGESKPIADNATKEGRAKNRRVEIYKAP